MAKELMIVLLTLSVSMVIISGFFLIRNNRVYLMRRRLLAEIQKHDCYNMLDKYVDSKWYDYDKTLHTFWIPLSRIEKEMREEIGLK